MNLQEQEQFYQMVTRSRAASLSTRKEDAIVTEIVNGLIVSSKPSKKIEYLSEPQKTEQEAKVWNLTKHGPVLESKAASVPVNKLQEILRFQMSNGRH